MNKHYPNIMTVKEVLWLSENAAAGLPDGRYVPARPMGWPTFGRRMKAAWLVFTGKADALKWTDRCAPPDGTDTEWHWIEMSRGPHLARWNVIRQSWWAIERGSLTPFQMQQTGYRYLRPARPDDAEARERLEKALRRLIDVADNAAIDCNTGVMDDAIAAAKEALNAR